MMNMSLWIRRRTVSVIVIMLSIAATCWLVLHQPDKPFTFADNATYRSLWRRADIYMEGNLPDLAAIYIKKAYLLAQTENNVPQKIKAITYDLRVMRMKEDDWQLKGIRRVESEIAKSRYPS